MTYAILLEPADDGTWSAFAPDLPGCVASGCSADEARAEMGVALRLHLESLRAHGEPVPEPRVRAADVWAD
jgi:predicted RNase H-like HicB family nuclease